MKQNASYINRYRLASLLMLLALSWLCISTPFVNVAREISNELALNIYSNSSETGNIQFPNSSEEKTETGLNNLSEYIQHHEVGEHAMPIASICFHNTSIALYRAFHEELLTPPPNTFI